MWNDKRGLLLAGGAAQRIPRLEGLTISLSSPLQSLAQTTGLALFLSPLLSTAMCTTESASTLLLIILIVGEGFVYKSSFRTSVFSYFDGFLTSHLLERRSTEG